MLPDDGECAVTVCLIPAARRNEHATYTLTVKLDGQARNFVPATQDALPGCARHRG